MKKASLYVHIPFCTKKCFYCSFVVSIGQEKRMDDYVKCLRKEIETYTSVEICSVYFGGGTPTLLSTKQLTEVVNVIKKHFDFVNDVEWTIEANPEGLTKEKLDSLHRIGFNRISLGVQTFSDKNLTYLGRVHDSEKAKSACLLIADSLFDNISVDMMMAFPGQSKDELQFDLVQFVGLNSNHISLYSLNIEENSRFFAKQVKLDSQETQAEYYKLVVDFMRINGYRQYEISNFAKPGKESRHNIHYWTGGQYIGVGVGAHGYVDGVRYQNVSTLQKYMNMVAEEKTPIEVSEEISDEKCFKDRLLFGLRMNVGVDLSALNRDFKYQLSSDEKKHIEQFVDGGFLVVENGRLRATDKGRLVLDELSSYLI